MSLELDARRRAMLEEFGVRLFDRAPEVQVAPRPAAQRPPIAVQAAPAAPLPSVLAPAALSGGTPSSRPPVDTLQWDALEAAVSSCRACRLCEGRRNTVFGVGDRQARWLLVGEAPGENEDLQGEPFVGQAGKLLDNMLRALGLGRHDQVYIANVLKCRPPANRNPDPAEVAQCEPFLRRQVQLLQPRIIVAMGRFAVQSLLGTAEPIGRLRGHVHSYGGVPLVVTYHPAYLLRNLADKAKAWSDLCLAASVLAGDRPAGPAPG